QLILAFSPDVGPADGTIQFSTGGKTANFTIPAGSTSVEFPGGPLALQTGTVAGTILLTARLQSNGSDLTPTPVSIQSIRVEPAAPTITSARFSRTADSIQVQITGYCTA